MTRSFRLGFALNVSTRSRGREELARVYAEILDTIEFAEQLGIDSVWIGQQHFDNTDGPIPSPLVFLATAAERTSRITLGTGITTLPFEDPIRLAEDGALLDILANGRLHVGLGTGGANLGGFSAFGLDSERRHDIFAEKLRRLHTALDGDSLVPDADGPRLFPSGEGLRGRLWQGAITVDEAVSAARDGDGIQLGTFFDPAGEGQRPKALAYLDTWKKAGHPTPPRIAVFRFVYSGASKDAVVEEITPVLGPRLRLLAERAAISGNHSLAGISVRDYLERIPFYGNAEDIVRQIEDDPVIPGIATDFVANFSHSDDFTFEQARARLTVLAREIGPALGWRPDQLPASA